MALSFAYLNSINPRVAAAITGNGLVMTKTKEHLRLEEPTTDPVAPWRKWGTYVSERAWGTVREDYSASGEAWDYLTHDMARSKA